MRHPHVSANATSIVGNSVTFRVFLRLDAQDRLVVGLAPIDAWMRAPRDVPEEEDLSDGMN